MSTLIFLAALSSFVYLLYRWRQPRQNFPPGPKGRFLVGNILDVPKSHSWRTFAKWGKVHDSDIMHLNLAGQSMIILNSFAAAEELMERRSANYSGRPRFPMLCELMGWDFNFMFMKYGQRWRDHRKLLYQSFNPGGIPKFHPHMTKATHNLLRNLLNKPDDFSYHLRHMTAELTLLITYGIRIQPERDPYVELANKGISTFAEALIPGRFLVDAFPILKHVPSWVPGADFKRKAKVWSGYARGMVELPYQAVRDDILAGRAIHSLVSDGLQNITENNSGDEESLKKVAAAIYVGGTGTTVASILNGLLALMCHPQVLKKAQAEIDSVVEPGQLPDWNDRDSLPYLSALVKEIWRWAPVVPLGIPHSNDSEDIYKDYVVPANSVVAANIWGILQDERMYPNPTEFNPDRFLKDGKLNLEILDPERVAFGFGRRFCPGKHFAVAAMWQTMASVVATFDITKPKDVNGKVIEPTLEWTHNAISFPVPFKCQILPRSAEAIAAIQRTEGYEFFDE